MSQAQRQGRTRRARTGEAIALMVPPSVRLRIGPQSFWTLCCANRDLRLERTSRGELIVMSPAGSNSGRRNARLTARLGNWATGDGTGEFFDSSAGFTLPNGAVRAPDASWIEARRWNAVPAAARERFAPICPDFVVELQSPSDSRAEVREKMIEYIDQGARLGWLIDPGTAEVEIYRPGRAVEMLKNPPSLSGDDVLPGFVLDLQGILFD